jgi:hypothetical protein
MKRLNEIVTSKPSKHLFFVQMHFLTEHINNNGGKCVKFHQFLYRIDIKGSAYYLKINLLDWMFFLITKNHSIPPQLFQSVSEIKNWFDNIKQAEQ